MTVNKILKIALDISDAVFTVGAGTTVNKVLNEDFDGARKWAAFTKKAAATSVTIGIGKIVADVVATKTTSSVATEEVVEEEVNEEVDGDE